MSRPSRIEGPLIAHYGMENSSHGYWDDSGTPPESYMSLLQSIIKVSPNMIFVDMGAGTGQIAQRLEKMGMKTIALDYSSVGMKKCGTKGVVASAESFPLGNNVASYVHAKDMIEHLDSRKFVSFLRESKRILKSGGKLIIIEKNYFSDPAINVGPWVDTEKDGVLKIEKIKVGESSDEAFIRINKKYGGRTIINTPYFPKSKADIIKNVQESGFSLKKECEWQCKVGEEDWFNFPYPCPRSVMVFRKI